MVGVFHKIGVPNEDHTVNSLEQILTFDGELTFDGAYESVFEHREALKDRGVILFVQGDTIGDKGVMTWPEIVSLEAEYGFVVGWHGWSHRKLTELSDGQVAKELKSIPNIEFYAYPHGEWDERVASLVQKAGFKRAYSTTQGEEGNDFAIPRQYV